MDFIEIIQTHPGLCRQVYVFCCLECKKIIYSFARYKRLAYRDAQMDGWKASAYSILWMCPDCYRHTANQDFVLEEAYHE